MSCRLLFVRHGQSLGNLTGRFLGITDLDLSPLGAVQARRTADYLKDEKIDVIYASDLIRACHTAQPLSEIKGLPIIKDKRLEEINAGLWENRTFDDLEKEFPESYEGVWLHDIGNSKADGGESVAHLTDGVFGVCDYDIYQLQNILFAAYICKGIVVHTLFEIYRIE